MVSYLFQQKKQTMAIKLSISPKLIPSVASLYNDTNRIFMEYIDNSLDSAEYYFNKQKNEYSKQIKICLRIKGTNCTSAQVIITDNSTGIINFNKVVESIGDSDKKNQFTTNGQFGFGIYSFMAACDKIDIISKTKNDLAHRLRIDSDVFKASKQDEVSFPEPKIVDFNRESGTTIILSDFHKETWKAIDLEVIKKEIERHFELLLQRGNLEIRIKDDKRDYLCKSFEYDSFQGQEYSEIITDLNCIKGKKIKEEFKIHLKEPIKIFLKITAGKIIDRQPTFVIKGRRISEIYNLKAFKSKHKSDIWNHPNLTGFIDLGSILEPTIARNEFKNTIQSKALFQKLSELEHSILFFLKDINSRTEENHYRGLEDILNKTLSSLAKEEKMYNQTENILGNELPQKLKNSSVGNMQLFEIANQTTNHEGNSNEKGTSKNKDIGGNIAKDCIQDFDGNLEGQEENVHQVFSNELFDEEIKINEKKKSGFNIQISERDPDVDGETNLPLKSTVVGSTIIIFRKHEQFLKRVDKRRTGECYISNRLITYLAGEITVHYKDKFVLKEGLSDYNKKMFVSVVEFIYKFEDLLSSSVGKNMADLM